MKVLAIDTSTMMATVAVTDEDKILGSYSLNQDMTHSEKLVPMVEQVLSNLNIKIEDIDLYAVGLGPGSFTGLRIGLATVKAWAHLFDKPLVGVSSLEGLAYNLAYNELVVPMIDARRSRVYTAIYSWQAGQLKEVMPVSLLEIDELLEKLKGYPKITVNGDGALLYKDKLEEGLGDKLEFAHPGQLYSQASSICKLGLDKYKSGQRDDYFTLAPDYFRPSQAERELQDREK